MTRKLTIVLGAVAAVLLLGACTTSNPIIFDESLPENQTTTIRFYYGLEITSYNGTEIPQKKASFLNPMSQSGIDTSEWELRYVVLPAGEMEFGTNIWYQTGGSNVGYTSYTTKNAFFQHTFDAGKKYVLVFTPWGGDDKKIWGVDVYLDAVKKANKIVFVPLYKKGSASSAAGVFE